MHPALNSHSEIRPSRGAVSLRNALIAGENDDMQEYMSHMIDHWMAILKHDRKNPNALTTRERRVFEWYSEQQSKHSYQANSWRISPEKQNIFMAFRSDPYYHLKNLVETIGRKLIEEGFREE